MQESQLLQSEHSKHKQFDITDKSLFQTVLPDSHHVLHHFLPAIKTTDTNLGFKLTVSHHRIIHPFMITVILSHLPYAVQRCFLIALVFVNCFNYMHFDLFCSVRCVVVLLKQYDDDDDDDEVVDDN